MKERLENASEKPDILNQSVPYTASEARLAKY